MLTAVFSLGSEEEPGVHRVSVTGAAGGSHSLGGVVSLLPGEATSKVLALFCESREDGATQLQGVRRERKAGSQAPETWGLALPLVPAATAQTVGRCRWACQGHM